MNPSPSPSLELQSPRRWSPILRAASAQLLACVLTGLVLLSLRFFGIGLDTPVLLLLQSSLAVALSWRMGMPIWWLAIQGIFVPAIFTVSALAIHPVWFLGAFVLLALIYGRTDSTQVPLYLSRPRVWNAILKQLPNKRGIRVLDLGSGLGGLVQYIAQARPDSHVSGIEAAPLPAWISKLRMMRARNAAIEWADFWHTDLSAYDVVCAYLSPVPMPDLWQKVQHEMRPGTLFISYRFAIPGVAPTQLVQLKDLGQTKLYVWRV